MIWRRSKERERGFTIIESVVAMIILMALFALVSRVITDGMFAKETSTATGSSITTMDRFVEIFGRDVRLAESPNRYDQPGWVIANAVDSSLRDLPGAANRDSLYLVTDAIAEDPGTTVELECVSYTFDAGGSLWRRISKYNGASTGLPCTATAIERTKVVNGISANDLDGNVKRSSGDVAANMGVTQSGVANRAVELLYERAEPPTSGDGYEACNLVTVSANNTPAEIARVINIVVVAKTIGNTRQGVASASVRHSFPLRTRANQYYLNSIGCKFGLNR